MALNKITKLAIATATSGGVAVGAYYALNKPTKIKDILGVRLLGFDDAYAQKWMSRVAKLAKVNDGLSNDIAKTKDDDTGLKLMQWCQKNVNNKFISENNQNFLEVQEYCTSSIKENVMVPLETTWNNRQKNNEKLINETQTVKLSDAMKSVKAKLTGEGVNKDEDALKNWCTEAYEKAFKSWEDQTYLDVKEYCQVIQGQLQN